MQTIVKLLLVCFLVGLILAIAGIDPFDIWRDLWATLADSWAVLGDIAHWSVRYILLGALIVVPIWVVLRLLGAIGENRGRERR